MSSPARATALAALLRGAPVFPCKREDDRHLTERLYYGVIQNERFLDACISRYLLSSRRLKPAVREILRMSAYQILFLERVPHSAAVNDAVSLCRENRVDYAAGFVNAVLRRIAQNREDLLSLDWAPPVRYSHPDWLYRALSEDFGSELAASFMKENQFIPNIRLQVNNRCKKIQAFLTDLENAGIPVLDVNPLLSSVLIPPMSVEKIPGYWEGSFYVQDDAARMAVHLTGSLDGKKVLDVCAAPGGKSMAAVLEGASEVTACDIDSDRLSRCRENFDRMHFPVSCCEQDAGIVNNSFLNRFDVVIADVPCSGTGVIRKHPEIRRKTDSEVEALLPLQQKILNTVSGYVKNGGVLLYATCSVLKAEDENQVEAFLHTHPAFVLDPVSAESFSCENRMMRSWPQMNHNDGFFACCLRRCE